MILDIQSGTWYTLVWFTYKPTFELYHFYPFYSVSAQLANTISDYYSLSGTVEGYVYDGSKYNEIESTGSDFNDEECGAYCYLDISTPCRAYTTVGTKCYLLDLDSGTSEITDTNNIKFNSGTGNFMNFISDFYE